MNSIKIFGIFILLLSTTLFSQQKTVIALGFNIVDDSFTSSYNPINISKSWHTGKLPSYFSLSSKIIDNTLLEVQLTSNVYDKGKIVNGEKLLVEKKYFSVDILTKYLLFQSRNYNSNLVVPFIALGMGNTKIDKQDYYTINYGVGSYFWFSDNENCHCSFIKNDTGDFGILFNMLGKSSLKQALYGNHIQYSIGLAYRIN